MSSRFSRLNSSRLRLGLKKSLRHEKFTSIVRNHFVISLKEVIDDVQMCIYRKYDMHHHYVIHLNDEKVETLMTSKLEWLKKAREKIIRKVDHVAKSSNISKDGIVKERHHPRTRQRGREINLEIDDVATKERQTRERKKFSGAKQIKLKFVLIKNALREPRMSSTKVAEIQDTDLKSDRRNTDQRQYRKHYRQTGKRLWRRGTISIYDKAAQESRAAKTRLETAVDERFMTKTQKTRDIDTCQTDMYQNLKGARRAIAGRERRTKYHGKA